MKNIKFVCVWFIKKFLFFVLSKNSQFKIEVGGEKATDY